MEIILIAAVDRNLAIGKDGKIPWDIKEDLNFFRRKTENNAIIINFYTLIKNILTLVSLKSIDKIKIIVSNNPIIYEKTIKFFNLFFKDQFL